MAQNTAAQYTTRTPEIKILDSTLAVVHGQLQVAGLPDVK